VRELKNGDVISTNGFVVKVHSVIHAQPILECFGYRLEAEGSSFAYSGDAGPCKAMEDLARNVDVMVHMCHFISGTALNAEFEKRNGGHLEIARLAQAAGVRNLVASHITEQMDVPGVKERLIREMSELYTGNLFFGEDLMEIPVGAPAPRKLD
jgi:ribonuclease Z